MAASLKERVRRAAIAVGLLNKAAQINRSPHRVFRAEASHDRPFRVSIITQPKAGTYLYAEIVRRLGFQHTFLHLQESKLIAFDRNFLAEGLQAEALFHANIPLPESVKLVRTGELCVSHILHSPQNARVFRNFRVLAIRRELRSALTSMARMAASAPNRFSNAQAALLHEGLVGFIRVEGASRIAQALEIANWDKEENCLTLRNEDLWLNAEVEISKIASWLDVKCGNPTQLFEEAKNTPTLTESSTFSKLAWDDAAEQQFLQLGGGDANRTLGYE